MGGEQMEHMLKAAVWCGVSEWVVCKRRIKNIKIDIYLRWDEKRADHYHHVHMCEK
jgi:hypothetical protein